MYQKYFLEKHAKVESKTTFSTMNYKLRFCDNQI